jgi:multidrug efflux pump subunit AcrB
MPEGILLTTWQDDAELLRSRLDLLLSNGGTGFLLVILILALFLRLKLSLWTSLGIPISFMGTFLLMPSLDISTNMISLFAFIVVLGIVVDDAIVVGESIYSQYEDGKSGIRAAVDGAIEMAVPVCFAIFTTVVAFSPLLAVPGTMGKIFKVIPLIVIPTLLFSLLECLFILPTHLSHLKHTKKTPRGPALVWDRFRGHFDRGLKFFIQRVYGPSLDLALSWRYATLAIGLAALILTIGYVGGGRIKFVFMPDVEADNVAARLTMPLGTPVEVTTRAVEQIESALERVRRELEEERLPGEPHPIRHILSSIGDQPSLSQSRGPMGGVALISGAHLAEVNAELALSENRSISSMEISDRWREYTGDIPDAVLLDFSSSLMSTGEAIDIQLAGNNVDELRTIAAELRTVLGTYPGVYDISDSFRAGKKEVKLRIKPQAEVLGLSQLDLARQVRQAFYGEEAQRIQRGRDDVRIMVRYPQEQRVSLGDLENMRIRAPGGIEVPISTVAETQIGRGYSTIDRVDRRRVISVTAKVDSAKANENEIVARLTETEIPEILAQYPGVM